MGNLKVDVDGDQKPDFQIDFKTLILVGGMVVSMTSSYVMLKSEIEVAKTMPKVVAPADDTRVVNQKLEYLIREFEKSEERIKDLERRVYKK